MEETFGSSNRFEIKLSPCLNPDTKSRFKLPTSQSKKYCDMHALTPNNSGYAYEYSQSSASRKSIIHGRSTRKNLPIEEIYPPSLQLDSDSEGKPTKLKGSPDLICKRNDDLNSQIREDIELIGEYGPVYFSIIDRSRIQGLIFENIKTISEVENDCKTDQSQIDTVFETFEADILDWLKRKESELQN